MSTPTHCLALILSVTPYLPSAHGQTSAPAKKIWDHILSGKLGPALQACQEWVEADGNSAAAHALLGEIHSRMGRTEKTIEAFKRALDIDQTNLAARIGLPRAYLTSGRVEDALRQVKMALAKNPRSPQTYRDVRRIVTRLVKSHGASGLMAFCRAWLESNPEDGRPHCVMGYAYESMGLLEEALEACVLASESDTGKAEAHLGVARLYEELGRLEPARSELREALAVAPGWITARAALAKLCLRSGQTEEALTVSREGLSVEGESAGAHALLGHVLAAREKALAEPKTEFEKALALDPACREAYFGLAALLQKSGKEEDAQDCWRRFLAIERSGKRADVVRNGWIVLHTRKVAEGQGWQGGGVTWSPDGRRLAFVASQRTLVVLPLKKPHAGQREIATTATMYYTPRWSPDGRHLAMLESVGAGHWSAAITPADGPGQPRQLRRAYGVTWSPIEEGVLFCNAYGPWEGFRGITVDGKLTGGMARPGSFRDAQGASWGLSLPDFAPDGQRVVFVGLKWAGTQSRRLFAFSGDNWSKRTQLTRGDQWSAAPDFSPDGRSIAYVSHAGAGYYDLWVVAADGSAGPALLATAGVKFPMEPGPEWSPDGREIAYGTRRGIMIARVGGLDRSPVSISAKQDGHRLTVAFRSRAEKSVTFDATYELFDPNSIRIARGPVGDKGMQLSAGDVVESSVDLDTPEGLADCVVKLTAVTAEGARSIKLAKLPLPE